MNFDELDKILETKLKEKEISFEKRNSSLNGRKVFISIESEATITSIIYWENPSYIDFAIIDVKSEEECLNIAGIDYSSGLPSELEETIRIIKSKEPENSPNSNQSFSLDSNRVV